VKPALGTLLGIAAVVACAGAASAHDFWIEPSSFEPAPRAMVSFRLAVGRQWQGEVFPRSAQRIVRFTVSGPDGERSVPGAEGSDPAGALVAGGPGIYVVAYQSNNSELALAPERFAESLRLEGLEWVLDERRRRGEEGQESREAFARCAKSLLRVPGGDGRREGYDHAFGLPLELVPERDPSALAPGESLPLRLLYRGRPLAGVLIVASPRTHPGNEVRARSDRQGRVTLRLPTAGAWLVKAVHMVRLEGTEALWQHADWQSWWASLTFELPAR
jgi:uncharacterized GH25 family protein